MESQRIEFETDDGAVLQGDVRVPTSASGAAIICHPHPQYGGNRFNPVVDALFQALPDAGIAALRFDFRASFDDGVGERRDAAAALERVRELVPGVPVFATGYSFGAMIVLAVDDDDLAAKVLIAPPLSHIDTPNVPTGATLVLTPAHDQFTAPEMARPVVESWPDAEYRTVDSVDHFLTGRSVMVAEQVGEWLSTRSTQDD